MTYEIKVKLAALLKEMKAEGTPYVLALVRKEETGISVQTAVHEMSGIDVLGAGSLIDSSITDEVMECAGPRADGGTSSEISDMISDLTRNMPSSYYAALVKDRDDETQVPTPKKRRGRPRKNPVSE